MSFKINRDIEIIASTPKNNDHYVGFHDIKPFNIENDDLLVMHRLPLKTSEYLGNKKNLEICLWNFRNSEVEKIDISNAWSWEQGSRLQWLNHDKIIYNKIIENELVACVKSISDKKTYNYKYPIYSISKDGNNYLYMNYSRLWKLWKSYGYEVGNNKNNIKKKPDDDGVFLSDFNNNKKLILSIDEAVEICGLSNLKDVYFFLTHPTFSPSGNKCVSLLRYISKSRALISYLICTSLKEKKNQLIASEKVSHFEWIDDEKIIVWCRNLPKKYNKFRQNIFFEKYIIKNIKNFVNKIKPNLRQKILSEYYHQINVNNPKEILRIGENILTSDGHPQLSNDGNYLITDTYPNKNGFQKLIIYNLNQNKNVVLGEFKVSEHLVSKKMKCDLHPRWNYKGDLISIDSSHEGTRQSYVLNIEKLIKNFNNSIKVT